MQHIERGRVEVTGAEADIIIVGEGHRALFGGVHQVHARTVLGVIRVGVDHEELVGGQPQNGNGGNGSGFWGSGNGLGLF